MKTDWLKQEAHVLTTSTYGLAVMKGQVISVATNIGSPVRIFFSPVLPKFLMDLILAAPKRNTYCRPIPL